MTTPHLGKGQIDAAVGTFILAVVPIVAGKMASKMFPSLGVVDEGNILIRVDADDVPGYGYSHTPPGVPGGGGSGDPLSPFFIRFDPNYPGRPDPKWSIDTASFDPNLPTALETRHGQILDHNQFWQEWAKGDTNIGRQTLSERNLKVIEAGYAPTVDDQWIAYFPEHAPFRGQTLEHHHVNYGQYAIPLPGEIHRGSGNYQIWHSREE